ncbi:MAG: ATP-binding protein [Pseudomonadota bacterium]
MSTATKDHCDRWRPSLKPFEITLDGSAIAVRQALAEVLEALTPLELGIEERSVVELVLAEVLNNVVEHAYDAANQERGICLRCNQRADGLHLHVIDAGHRMSDQMLPFAKPPPITDNLADLPEGGFGWFLIRDLAKDICYAREAGKNHLRLRLAIATRLLG